ncbi:hemolysin secretion protein D [Neiella marina]|uniref:Hemolysin secretion protein D n=1 Tax=Neiella marina TaxID=508461 RepID=A0A8J2U6H3_9GAMM|nr:hemolysin secretion protein D [Neiella marina]
MQLSAVQQTDSTQAYRFPATVTAVKTVELNFEVSGRLKYVDLKQGQRVQKGTLLAAIDAAPFERSVRENRARHKQARLELERIQSLYKKGLAAKRELDNAETQFEITKVDLENSIQDLSYTELRAPFDALVSERLVEADSYIVTGTAITRLQDVSKVHFEINVSERVLAANIDNKILSAKATVAGRSDNEFELEYVEHTTAADPVTQTYKVVFASEPPADTHLTPGIRASANVVVGHANDSSELYVPLNALQVNPDNSYSVWRYNAKQKVVEQVAVEIGTTHGHMVVIKHGLALGDQVVSAGVSQMREGLAVKPYVAE